MKDRTVTPHRAQETIKPIGGTDDPCSAGMRITSATRPAALQIRQCGLHQRQLRRGGTDLGPRHLRLHRHTSDRTWLCGSARARPPSSGAPPGHRVCPVAEGHVARCTEPSCHHDHTSSVTNGSTGANSRSSVVERRAQRRPGRVVAAVGPLLHQLDVVVAERPEEPLGDLERRRVVVPVERRRGRRDHSGQFGQHRPGRAASVTASDAGVPRPEHELRRVEQLRRQPPPDAHLRLVVGQVGTRPALRRPVAHRVDAVLGEQPGRASRRTRRSWRPSCGPCP